MGGAQPGSHLMHILLVEDDEDVRYMIVWILRQRGHEVTEAPSAEVALDLVTGGGEFDGAICDFMLQGSNMDGGQLSAALKHLGVGRVVVMTAAPQALQMNPPPEWLPVVKKPFSADDLAQYFDE